MTCDLSNSLKSSWSWVIWLVQPLSTNQHSLKFLLVKHIATNNYFSSCWYATWATFFCWKLLLQIFTWCPNLLHFFTHNIKSSLAFEKTMTHSAIVFARRKFFVIFIIVASVSCSFLGVEIFLVFLPLAFLPLVTLLQKAVLTSAY